MPRPRVDIDPASIQNTVAALEDFVGIRTKREAEEIGEEMVQEVRRIVSGLFADAPSARKINTTRIENSFTYDVVKLGRSSWTVALTILPGVSSGKIWALNYGRSGDSKNYTILPRNVPRALEFNPYDASKGAPRSGGKYAGRVLRPYANRTSAGASKGYGFMEEARANVLRRRGYDALV